MRKNDPSKNLVMFLLTLDTTNDEIALDMRVAKGIRENNEAKHIILFIDGFDDDRRELGDIPEVRAFCRRLVTQGFISYLDFTTTLPPCEGGLTGWGACEVLLCSEGRMKNGMEITRKDLEHFRDEVLASNARADALVGPYTPR